MEETLIPVQRATTSSMSLARDDPGVGVVELQALGAPTQIFFLFSFFLGIETRLSNS